MKTSLNQKKLGTENIFINNKSYKDLLILFTRYHTDKSIAMSNLYYDKLIEKSEDYEGKIFGG